MTSTNTTEARKSLYVVRALYILSIVTGLYFLIFSRNVADAMSTLGLGLIFDPFDSTVAWKERPRYQKVWLVIHVVAVFALLGWLLAFGSKY